MPRGGSRTGTKGTAYQNRSDLQANAGKPLPIKTPPSTQYGSSAASVRSQQAVPMAPQSGPPPVAAPAPTGAAPGALAPGSFGDLLRPTENPDEPVTAGLPVGPGPGPEVLSMTQFAQNPQAQQFATTRDMLTALAASHPSPALATLAMYGQRTL